MRESAFLDNDEIVDIRPSFQLDRMVVSSESGASIFHLVATYIVYGMNNLYYT